MNPSGRTSCRSAVAHLDIPGATLLFARSISKWPNLLLFSAGGCGCYIAWRSNSPRWKLLAFFCIFAWTLPAVAAFQSGAGPNYLLEGWLASALLLPLAVQEATTAWLGVPTPVQLAVLLLFAGGLAGTFRPYNVELINKRSAGYGEVSLLRNYAVLSDAPYLEANSLAPEVLDPYLVQSLEKAGRWSSAPLRDQVQR